MNVVVKTWGYWGIDTRSALVYACIRALGAIMIPPLAMGELGLLGYRRIPFHPDIITKRNRDVTYTVIKTTSNRQHLLHRLNGLFHLIIQVIASPSCCQQEHL